MESTCPICKHAYDENMMTDHHLIPKSRGGKNGDKIEICKYCHDHIHDLFTEKELAICYNTFSSLLNTPEMKRWINWIRKRKPNGKLKRRRSKRRK